MPSTPPLRLLGTLLSKKNKVNFTFIWYFILIQVYVHMYVCMLCSVLSWVQLFCDPMDYSLPGFSEWDFPDNTGVCCHLLLQRTFPIEDLTPLSCMDMWIL